MEPTRDLVTFDPRALVFVALYMAGVLAVATHFFESAALPGLSFPVVVLLTGALGLIIGRWLVLPLSAIFGVLVPVWGAQVPDEIIGPVTSMAVVGAALLLTLTVALHRWVSRTWSVRVGFGLAAIAGLCFAWAGYSQLSPRDVKPPQPLLVDVEAGIAGTLSLGEPIRQARQGLGERTASEIETDGYNLSLERYGNLALWYRRGHLNSIEVSYEGEYQTAEGVGVGDSMSHARDVYPGLVCDQDEFGDEECAGRDGDNILFLTGNPIRTLELSNLLCYPGLESGGGGDLESTTCLQAQHPLHPSG